jgi:hypothetical protein
MQEYGGGNIIDPNFLDLDTSWRWVVSFTPLPLYPRRKCPQYTLDRMLGGPQSRSGLHGENSCPHWDSNSDPSTVQPVASHYTDYAIPAPPDIFNEHKIGDHMKDVVNVGHYLFKVRSSMSYPVVQRETSQLDAVFNLIRSLISQH